MWWYDCNRFIILIKKLVSMCITVVDSVLFIYYLSKLTVLARMLVGAVCLSECPSVRLWFV